jgi:hypothetical protein
MQITMNGVRLDEIKLPLMSASPPRETVVPGLSKGGTCVEECGNESALRTIVQRAKKEGRREENTMSVAGKIKQGDI